MFLSFALTEVKCKYHITERKTLAVVQSLKEVQWLVKESSFSMKLYTDHSALLSVLWDDNELMWIVRWSLHLSEYDLKIKHVSEKKLTVTDKLSQIRESVLYATLKKNIELSLLTLLIKVMNTDDDATEDNPKSERRNENWVLKKKRWEQWLQNSWYRAVMTEKL